MSQLAVRFAVNPLLKPADVRPSIAGVKVECLLNPGVFRYGGRTGLLLRVAERPEQSATHVSTPVLDDQAPGGIRVVSFAKDDPDLAYTDPRIFAHKGEAYLTTLSHLRLAWSDDGIHFTADASPTLLGEGELESFGIEDCRVTELDGRYLLTYTAVSPSGVGVGLRSTRDWVHFENHGVIIPPHNKDCAIFAQRVGGKCFCFHRPSGLGIGGNYIWLASSPDLLHWGGHRCIARTRAGMWDEDRVGAGAAPIATRAGLLAIYHGANRDSRYCLGALLLDANDPSRVLARSTEPIMEPTASYEQEGFFGKVVFTNGHVVDGDRVTIYYGASDSVICAATFSLEAILASLGV